MGTPERPSPLSDLLGAALDDEARRLDLVVARAWIVFWLVALVGALVVAATVHKRIGLAAAAVAAVTGLWFFVAATLFVKGRGGRALSITNSVVESSLPWVALVLLLAVQGATYALGSWVPPMLFCGLIVASVVRLRPLAPLLIGISSALAFLVLHLLFVRHALPPETAGQPLYSLSMQVTRAGSLLFSGALSALVCRGLRDAIGRAGSSARAQDLFGKYRLLRRVASGGMGEVHEALYCPEGGFERRVAIKRIHPHLAEQPSFVSSFRAEAELCARLAHPNVVQVLDFGRVADTYFLAMEFVDGLTLGSLLRRLSLAERQVPEALVTLVGRELLAGLAYSHAGARGSDGRLLRVIHRDLSPSNVLLSRNGEVKISDFGLARALRDATSGITDHVAGHAGYMAPEQAKGEAFDERCDLFAVGVILWEALAGRRLFQRDAQATTLLALVADPAPPISALRANLHPAWDTFLSRALEKEPFRRFASAREMAQALDAIPTRTESVDLGRWVTEATALSERRDPRTTDEVSTELMSPEEMDLGRDSKRPLVGPPGS